MRISVLILFIFISQQVEAQTSTLVVADSLFAIGNYEKAIKIYESQSPIKAKTYQKIAAAQQARGLTSEALKAYQKAIEKDNNLTIVKSRYAKLLRQTKQFNKADSLYKNLINEFPENPNFHYQMGLVKQQLKDSTAVSYFHKTLEKDSLHLKVMSRLAKHYFKKKDYHKADAFAKKGLQINNQDVQMSLIYAQTAYALKSYHIAIERYLKVIDLGYESSNVYERLGMAYYQESDIEKAITYYKKAVELDIRKISAQQTIGQLLLINEKPHDAEKHLLIALQLAKPQLDNLYQNLGLTYKAQDNFKNAIEYFRLALKENPNKIRSQFELAVAIDNYYADLETRLSYYNLFIKKFKSHPKAENYLALAYRRISDIKKEQHLSNN
ncbi:MULTISPECIES: tetratricopeptide repeat protein [Psychroflexus]|uniref:Tfp pilus assembly protein PilF n=1 Tax=Psychroflexus halocasei TaxID=908615 RepID=A0A1H3X9Z9_9FLAO|nr:MULTISPECIES: tetratricopeptide repeat protein [Psychroflexus]PJX20777.1 hypothetical protein CAP47_11100 [Psychroflexus sp. S27]SDZ95494.1 Tfp pilus assembly protein PilF [Psychroflexus halocasei]